MSQETEAKVREFMEGICRQASLDPLVVNGEPGNVPPRFKVHSIRRTHKVETADPWLIVVDLEFDIRYGYRWQILLPAGLPSYTVEEIKEGAQKMRRMAIEQLESKTPPFDLD